MQIEETHFHSDGLRLAADYFWPDDDHATAPRPIVIANSGFTGLRHIHPARFARFLTTRGLSCFAFDYRGFADSEGPRHRVILEEQVRDIMHAAAFVSGDERVDANRLVLLGWGMGAGLVVDAARHLSGILGLVAANGFYNGARVQLAHRGRAGLDAFLREVHAERANRARGAGPVLADPFDIYPLDAQSRQYVDDVLRRTPNYEASGYSFELADSLIGWNPEALAAGLDIPLLIAHGTHNRLHPPTEAESLHRRYGGASELFWIDGAGHTEFMHDDDPAFRALATRIADWVDHRLHQTVGA